MDHREANHLRLYVLAGFLAVVLLVYLGVLFDIQVNDHDDYVEKSIRSIARVEDVEASRGIITDRNGRVLVSNRSAYNLTFDTSLLKAGQDENEAILRLVELCRSRGVTWNDGLPITQEPPFSYTVDSVSDTQKARLLSCLKSLKPAKKALETYLAAHPEVLAEADEDPDAAQAETSADETETAVLDGGDLLEQMKGKHLSARLLADAGISATTLVSWMRDAWKVSDSCTLSEGRLILGVQYGLKTDSAYVLAEDVDTQFISVMNDGGYVGGKIVSTSIREYETTYAAHILGTVGKLQREDLENPLYDDYPMDATIGKSGVESAFEEYLHGTNGKRVVSSNEEGKITGEYYKTDPQPGSTVELTLDLELQQVVEDALAETVSKMNAEDGDDTRGAAAVVEKVGTGEILALASYPTYDLSTYRQSDIYAALSADPAKPFQNRATSGLYAPGSTLKPLTAVAALESGITTLTEIIKDTGHWIYPGTHEGPWCWKRSGHGKVNVVSAITNSCNYFFAEMGYRMGMDTLREYLSAFGLGEKTGIETGDSTGTLPENETGRDYTPQAAFGQANQRYTPIQLANYIATLVSGGKHCDAHLLKAVKAYDNSEVLAVGDTTPKNTVEMKDSTLNAVKEGMLGYTQPGGMVYSYFKDCVVTAGAKTGTAQLGGGQTNNGVFVCFAPYDDPEIVVSMVIEHGNAGAALASTAVKILNAYFSADEIGTAVIGEDQLMQ